MVPVLIMCALAKHGYCEDFRSKIEHLPIINFGEQCDEYRNCDRTVEDKVFSTLEEGCNRIKLGMTKADMQKIYGRPKLPEGEEESWKDIRFDNQVTAWKYATSLSGTTAFYLIFVKDRIDYCGLYQMSQMMFKYGKPGWSVQTPGERPGEYRFSGKE